MAKKGRVPDYIRKPYEFRPCVKAVPNAIKQKERYDFVFNLYNLNKIKN